MNKSDTSNKDRVIVITGAGGGFGHALLEKLAPQGARLALADLAGPQLVELADQALKLGASDVVTGTVSSNS